MDVYVARLAGRPEGGGGGRGRHAVGVCANLGAVEFAQALVADELWGWPVTVLDHLQELRQQAWKGEISLEEWRERDTASRAGLPDLDLDEIAQFQNRWIDEWIGDFAPDSDEEGGDRLMRRLAALLEPAPTDEQLWDKLAGVSQELAAPKRERRLVEAYRRRRTRIAEWLTRPGGGIDPVTGLPWAQINRYRVIDEPDLGLPVPQYVELARALAEDSATTEDLQRAEMVRDAADWRRMAVPMGRMQAHYVTLLPRLLRDAADDEPGLRPLLTDLERIWTNPLIQRLLFRETSRGWPVERSPEP
jgi:hypothetical protein